MTDRLIERTLRAFSDDLSADAPVPGGGSAAAYAGAMGAALAAGSIPTATTASRGVMPRAASAALRSRDR